MPSSAKPLSRNAACPCGSGKRSKHCCDAALTPRQLSPDYANRELAVSQQLVDAGQFQAAHQRTTALIKDAPDLGHAYYLAGISAWHLGQWEQAEELLGKAIERAPLEARYYCNWGQLLLNINRAEQAMLMFRRGLELCPHYASLHYNLAQSCATLGRFSEAQQAYRMTLQLEPEHDGALLGLAQAQRYSETPTSHLLLAEVLSALEKATQPLAQCQLNYALCKIYDDLGHVEGAMAAAHRANAIEAVEQPYQDAKYQRRITHNVERNCREHLPCATGAPDMPILIVGLPRSGTSLIEQILTRHPHIGSAGELNFWDSVAGFGDTILQPDKLQVIRTAYRRILATYAPQRERVIDKMPDNFWHVGLFLRAFPHGRVIHCRRNPVDTGLSIYLHRFTGEFDYSHNLEHIARYTRHYRDMVAHWQAELPATHWLDVDYEALVEQSAVEIRRLADFVGVGWDAHMLAPHAGQQPVRTSSAWQVRQPIYRDAVERWRRYERHLGPLLPLLDDLPAEERAA